MADVDLTAIAAAHDAIRERVLATPLVEAGRLHSASGAPIRLKAECLQPTGSFKVRGAAYKLGQLDAQQRARGVIAYSTGNHAQAVARAASQYDVPATIVMSPDVPPFKLAATRRWGAEIEMSEASSRSRREVAERLADERGQALIAPYDDLDVITGQATVGLELMRQSPLPPAAVLVPIGGGGLIAGIAAAVKLLDARVRVIGVEPELENDACLSFRAGQPVTIPGPSDSIADAIKVQTLGELTWPLIHQYVDDVVTVSEDQILEAVGLCALEARLVVEPSGALPLAAALRYEADVDGQRPVVAVASGGNITPDVLRAALARVSG